MSRDSERAQEEAMSHKEPSERRRAEIADATRAAERETWALAAKRLRIWCPIELECALEPIIKEFEAMSMP